VSDVPPPPGGSSLPPPSAGGPPPPPSATAPSTPPSSAPPPPPSTGGPAGGAPSSGGRPNRLPLIIGAVVVVLVVIIGIVVVVGGGGDDDDVASGTTTTAGPTTTAAGPGTTVASGGAVSDVQDVQRATVQIVAQGALRDPAVGMATVAGSGSGFIIDPSGLIVTNNHVVTGAATLEVFVGGDDRGRNARILGVSECNDLALIQLTGGGDHPYLEWYDGEIRPGLDVYAAGFPLGNPEFTLTSGIVAKARAGGDLTGTSSIDHTIEHDANIQPGNSGGPLVTPDGKVVAVNYAGGDLGRSGTNQFFAIASDLARPVVDRLRDGDFESLGINGWAVVDEESGLAGIWVAGVATGSPASETGIQPGDIVTTLQNLPVGRDGTFKDYCDVIRTAGDGAKIAVEVIRFDTQQVLKGELNGKELVESFSFAQELDDDVDAAPTTDFYADYDLVIDDSGRLQVEVPAEWRERTTDGEPLDDGTVLPAIEASTDLASYYSSYSVPGMQFALLDGARAGDIDLLLDTIAPGDGECSDGGRHDYSDAVFRGRYHLYTGCGTAGATYITLTAAPSAGGSYLALVAVRILTEADLQALDRILGTFNVIG